MTKRSELEPLLIAEWKQWSKEDVSIRRVMHFFAYLQNEKPELLAFRAKGDKYQVLKVILSKHVTY